MVSNISIISVSLVTSVSSTTSEGGVQGMDGGKSEETLSAGFRGSSNLANDARPATHPAMSIW